ncbi:MAG TPA: hypothetical protein ENF73_03310, partial [Proteobacteria bacterium]|nr:hypothetical protein [Pseudomonadota bacterium]
MEEQVYSLKRENSDLKTNLLALKSEIETLKQSDQYLFNLGVEAYNEAEKQESRGRSGNSVRRVVCRVEAYNEAEKQESQGARVQDLLERRRKAIELFMSLEKKYPLSP